jgi:hypothetical protein
MRKNSNFSFGALDNLCNVSLKMSWYIRQVGFDHKRNIKHHPAIFIIQVSFLSSSAISLFPWSNLLPSSFCLYEKR